MPSHTPAERKKNKVTRAQRVATRRADPTSRVRAGESRRPARRPTKRSTRRGK